MEPQYKYLLGEGVYPPLANMDICLAPQLGIFASQSPMELPNGVHVHDSYEFSIPLSVSPRLILENEQVLLERGKIYAFNSAQTHGTCQEMSGVQLIALQIDKSLVTETAFHMYGKSNVWFHGKNYMVAPQLYRLIQSFRDESREQNPGVELMLSSLSTQLVATLLRTVGSNLSEPLRGRRYFENDMVKEVIELFEANYATAVSLNDVARAVNYSSYHFIRIFKDHTGHTPNEYLINLRLKKACRYLRSSHHSITEVAHLCGFGSSSYFCRVFAERMGVTPLKYRREATLS